MNEQRLRILLVDDYPDALDTWSAFLEMQGFEVTTAADGKEAVERAVSERPSLIIMDLALPVVSGFDAARRLRSMPETARIPLIAATGYSAPAQIEDATHAGFDVVLIKPCDPDELMREVTRLLDAARQRDGQLRSDVG